MGHGNPRENKRFGELKFRVPKSWDTDSEPFPLTQIRPVDLLPHGLDRRSDTANVLNAGRRLRPPGHQELFDTRAWDVYEAFVEKDPTLLPPVAMLRGALWMVHNDVGGVLPDGDPNSQAKAIAMCLKMIVGKFRELATNADRMRTLSRKGTLAHREMVQKVVSRVVQEQTSSTPNARGGRVPSLASSSYCSRVDADWFDDDADFEAELAMLEEGEDADLKEYEKESGIHPSPRS